MAIELNNNDSIEYEPSTGYRLPDEGWYRLNIFDSEMDIRKGDPSERFLRVTYRINGGDFDGDDVKDHFMALYGKGMFKVYDLLTALGEIDKYYVPAPEGQKGGRWKALPEPSDLEGKAVWAQIEHEPFQSSDKQTKELKWNPDGTPVILQSPRVTLFAPKSTREQDLPAFRTTVKKQLASPAGQGNGGTPQYAGAGAATAAPAADPNTPW